MYEGGAAECLVPSNKQQAMWLQEEDVETVYGSINVIIQGDRSKPAIMTYHDIGLNSYVTSNICLLFYFRVSFPMLKAWR